MGADYKNETKSQCDSVRDSVLCRPSPPAGGEGRYPEVRKDGRPKTARVKYILKKERTRQIDPVTDFSFNYLSEILIN